MVAIRLDAVVGEDRRLVIELPAEIPSGDVELWVRSKARVATVLATTLTRQEAEQRLRAAGLLAEAMGSPVVKPALSQEELWEIGKPLKPTMPAHEQIIQERNER
jgi:hypothetical protein